MLSRVTSGRTPALLIRLECMVRKLRKSTVAGKPSFLIVGFKCRRSKLRRFTGPPFALVRRLACLLARQAHSLSRIHAHESPSFTLGQNRSETCVHIANRFRRQTR